MTKTIKESEFFIWEEKDLTEVKKKSENKEEFVETNFMNKIDRDCVKNEWHTGNEKKNWTRNCPICNKEIKYTNLHNKNSAEKYKSKCKICSQSGKKLTDEHKRNIGLGCKGKFIGNLNPSKRIEVRKIISEKAKLRMVDETKNPMYGKKHSDETKKKIKNLRKLQPPISPEGIIKCSSTFRGKHHSKDTKKLLRTLKLERVRLLGIPTNQDKDSKEWFINYNKENNSNFQSKTFMEIGYVADGYDKEKHIWIEYDTIYHKNASQCKKDLIRQNNIICHFKNIKNPLKKFIRIITWKNNKEKIVYNTN